jgi:probable aminopeptidase NPEPL1
LTGLGGPKRGGPERLVVSVLPDRMSRSLSPSRSEAIRRVMDPGRLEKKGRGGLVLVVDKADDAPAALAAVARALPCYSAKSSAPSPRKLAIAVVTLDAGELRPTAELELVLNVVRDTAELVDTPPSELTPEAFAARAEAWLGALPSVTTQLIVGDELAAHGLGGIHAVGRAAPVAPRLLVATYRPGARTRGAGSSTRDVATVHERDPRHIALVGKGITYDTGGLALKVGGVMVGMKADMAGAAACLGAFRLLVSSGFDRPLSLVLPMAENSIGRHAYRNDDVLRMHSGKTVEINNTDAEGRLLLADGVSWAGRVLGATTILDAATLTGAQLVATGKVFAAVMSNEEALEAHAVAAGRATGDHVHPLLFAPELFKAEFRSKIADMMNSVADRNNAPSSAAGQFIFNHLEGLDVAWAHVDLAGPAFPDGRATGFGALLLAAIARRIAAE